ncbi:MAG: chemotaxis protein CheD [Pseudomonadota bacterium]
MDTTQENLAESKGFFGEDRREIDDYASYFDSLVEAKPLDIPIGRFRCSNLEDVMLVTTVGTGIGICIHEPEIKAGGLGHLLLPESLIAEFPSFSKESDELRKYCEQLMNSMIMTLTQLGGKPSKMKAKLFGAGDFHDNDDGRKVYVFAKEFLIRNGLQISSEDIGQKMGRRIQYIPVSGRGIRRLLKRESDLVEISEAEQSYAQKFDSAQI